jgi:hypothetical protein
VPCHGALLLACGECPGAAEKRPRGTLQLQQRQQLDRCAHLTGFRPDISAYGWHKTAVLGMQVAALVSEAVS